MTDEPALGTGTRDNPREKEDEEPFGWGQLVAGGKSHGSVAWLASTERGQLIIFLFVCSIQRSLYQRSDLFHSVGWF